MFEENMKLVYWLVLKKYKNYPQREDILQEGFLGLHKAVKTYDKNRGIKFSSYAVRCIDNSIKMFLRHNNKNITYTDIDDLRNNDFEIDFNKLEIDLIMRQLSVGQKAILNKLLAGETQGEIANDFGLSQASISRKLKEIKDIVNEK